VIGFSERTYSKSHTTTFPESLPAAVGVVRELLDANVLALQQDHRSALAGGIFGTLAERAATMSSL